MCMESDYLWLSEEKNVMSESLKDILEYIL